MKMAKEEPLAWLHYNRRMMCRIYPAGGRFDSSNYNPMPLWAVGCQLGEWQLIANFCMASLIRVLCGWRSIHISSYFTLMCYSGPQLPDGHSGNATKPRPVPWQRWLWLRVKAWIFAFRLFASVFIQCYLPGITWNVGYLLFCKPCQPKYVKFQYCICIANRRS